MTASAAASSRFRKASTTPSARRSSPSWPQQVEHDAHGNIQLSGTGALADLLCEEIKNKLGIKRVRGDTFGYLQRSFIGCVSDVDQREAREVGEKAVQYAMWGDRRRLGGDQAHRLLFGRLPADRRWKPVAGKTRVMEDEFMPPTAPMSPTPSASICARCSARDMPDAFRLRPNKVEKVLNKG